VTTSSGGECSQEVVDIISLVVSHTLYSEKK
jgi:hypothetical protein